MYFHSNFEFHLSGFAVVLKHKLGLVEHLQSQGRFFRMFRCLRQTFRRRLFLFELEGGGEVSEETSLLTLVYFHGDKASFDQAASVLCSRLLPCPHFAPDASTLSVFPVCAVFVVVAEKLKGFESDYLKNQEKKKKIDIKK